MFVVATSFCGVEAPPPEVAFVSSGSDPGARQASGAAARHGSPGRGGPEAHPADPDLKRTRVNKEAREEETWGGGGLLERFSR